MAHFSAGLTYLEYWLQAWLSVNGYNTLTFGCIVCFHVSLFKRPHLCGKRKEKKKTWVPWSSTVHTPTLFWSQVRGTAVGFFFFMVFSSFCRIFIITARELTDQSERTHWRRYLLYLFMKLPSSHRACSGGWILSRAERTKMLSVQRIVYSHCR